MHTWLLIQLMDQLPLRTFRRCMARYPTWYATLLCFFLRPPTETLRPLGVLTLLPRFIGDLLYSAITFSEVTYGHVDDRVSYFTERTRT